MNQQEERLQAFQNEYNGFEDKVSKAERVQKVSSITYMDVAEHGSVSLICFYLSMNGSVLLLDRAPRRR